jgi:hypothetical protein
MNKSGEGGKILGWIILSFFGVVIICGFISPNLCDRLLIGVGVSGLIWLFFGSSMLLNMETERFLSFLFLTIILLLIWITLKGIGVCIPFSDIIKGLPL